MFKSIQFTQVLVIGRDNNGPIATPGFEEGLDGQLPFRGYFTVFFVANTIAKPQGNSHFISFLIFRGNVFQYVRVHAQVRTAVAVLRVRNTDLAVVDIGVLCRSTNATVGLAAVAHALATDDVHQPYEIGLFRAVVAVLD